MEKERTVAFIPVRLASSRLHEKHLKIIGDRPLLSWVIYRLEKSREVDEIVICAPDEELSKKLNKFTEKGKVSLFIYEGYINDVVGRLTTAAQKYDASICVLASGDCPLISSETVDIMIQCLKENSYAGSVTLDTLNNSVQIHEGIVVSRRWLWELAEKYSNRPELREHHFPVYYNRIYPEKFNNVEAVSVQDEEIYYRVRHRISVDTSIDLQFMNKVYEELKSKEKEFELKNVIHLLQEKPELTKINSSVYKKGLFDKTLSIIFFINTGELASTKLNRAIEVADMLTSRYGSGVKFLLTEDRVRQAVKLRGYDSHIGKTETLCRLYEKSGFDRLVLDLDKDFEIEQNLLNKLKSEKTVRVIDLNSIETEMTTEKIADTIIGEI